MTFKTQAEIFQALLDGNKLKSVQLLIIKYFHLVDGHIVDDKGCRVIENFSKPSDWSIYEEPKPKRQVWQWRYLHERNRNFVVSNLLMDEADAAKEYAHEYKYEKHAGPFEVEL